MSNIDELLLIHTYIVAAVIDVAENTVLKNNLVVHMVNAGTYLDRRIEQVQYT